MPQQKYEAFTTYGIDGKGIPGWKCKTCGKITYNVDQHNAHHAKAYAKAKPKYPGSAEGEGLNAVLVGGKVYHKHPNGDLIEVRGPSNVFAAQNPPPKQWEPLNTGEHTAGFIPPYYKGLPIEHANKHPVHWSLCGMCGVVVDDQNKHTGWHADTAKAGKQGPTGAIGYPGPQGEPGAPGKDADPEELAALTEDLKDTTERLDKLIALLEALGISVPE